jgi:hypothetical protein
MEGGGEQVLAVGGGVNIGVKCRGTAESGLSGIDGDESQLRQAVIFKDGFVVGTAEQVLECSQRACFPMTLLNNRAGRECRFRWRC